ncbi:FAD-binding domain-containing protein [Corynespora cassiicola Philippines]|uniref:FAD-binding domain-containing protein n=1 Tax=Corynespora cassiicola Philippines TaxID=1448308 RepID=A0A2T2NA92_CORCC|nr:FAD-binding domain-containing protein [Corynespora cassiicola Philippines]
MAASIRHLLFIIPFLGTVLAIPAPPSPTPEPVAPPASKPPPIPKGADVVDVSVPLPELFNATTTDLGDFLEDQSKKEADQSQYTLLESVSGGYWNTTGPAAPPVELPLIPDAAPPAASPAKASVSKRALPAAVKPCLEKAKLKIYTPADKSWAKYSTPYNTRVKGTADVVVLAKSSSDVQKAVVCAAKSGISVQARAGGHSYAGYSSRPDKGGMVIDLRNMASVTHNKGSAVVEAGIRLGNLALALLSKGESISHGDCPAVGLAGHSLHGGFGYSSRMWGLSTDAITALDVVTADGYERHVDQRTESELYWALRGAADSLGIVTRIYIKTQEAPKNVVHFTFNLNNIFGDNRKMAKAFVETQKCTQNSKVTDKNLGLTVRIAPGSYRIAGYYYGTKDQFSKINTCLQKATGIAKPEVENLSYAKALATIGGRTPLKQPADANNVKGNFYAKSLLVPENEPLSDAIMREYFSRVVAGAKKFPDQFVFTMRLMGGAGSVIARASDRTSAVANRDTLWIIQHDGNTAKNPRDMQKFIHELTMWLYNQKAGGYGGFKGFAPFVDPAFSRKQAHFTYFGQGSAGRVADVKQTYDPKDIFANPQSFKPKDITANDWYRGLY